MIVGLISDTHGKLRPEVFEKLAGVERILHAGDVGDSGILIELAAIAPVDAVWGNTDDASVRRLTKEVVELELAGRRIVVMHGHQLGSPRPASLKEAQPDADVIVYGHTHMPLVETVHGALIVNPGAAGPARFKLRPTVALLTLPLEEGHAPAVRIVDL